MGKLERLREIHTKNMVAAREKTFPNEMKMCWDHDDLTTCRYISVVFPLECRYISVRFPLNFRWIYT